LHRLDAPRRWRRELASNTRQRSWRRQLGLELAPGTLMLSLPTGA
jgi:hypothetical protein